MEKETSREELVKKSNTLRNELSEISSQIKNLDIDDKIKNLSQYVGKYFKTRDKSEIINCCYIYEIDKSENNNINLCGINVFHYGSKYYFGVKHDDLFLYDILNGTSTVSWLNNKSEDSEFIEITKEEFDKHLDFVTNLIKSKNDIH